ncbi:MAG: LytTR family DNA-binding domain-containing protein [Acidobacteriota bacterium]|nr:LytTR family DNA-binding domain-containing protein [Acidobacteriota bacterium]
MDVKPQIKALIVDGEPSAQNKIRTLLKDYPEVSVIGETNNGSEAVSIIQESSPDLIFLDIELLGTNGLSIIQDGINEHAPLIILISESDNYGLAAFEAGVVDYLLKPFNEVRLNEAIQRVVKQLSVQKDDDQLQLSALIESLVGKPPRYLRQITSRSGNRIFLVKVEDIAWIEAERNYVRIHSNGNSYLRRESIGNIESQLDPTKFRRIHRSAIVNLDFVRELQSAKNGDYKVILHSGGELTLSRSFHANMREFFR